MVPSHSKFLKQNKGQEGRAKSQEGPKARYTLFFLLLSTLLYFILFLLLFFLLAETMVSAVAGRKNKRGQVCKHQGRARPRSAPEPRAIEAARLSLNGRG